MPRPSKPPFVRRLLRPLPILSTVAVLLVAGWFVFAHAGVWESYGLRKQKRAQAAQIRELELQKQQIAEYYAALKAGREEALERAAREHGLVAPTETIYEIKVEEPVR